VKVKVILIATVLLLFAAEVIAVGNIKPKHAYAGERAK
jgi:hypothetical protein